MGYLNEFPHFESNKLNLDWLLEQYSTFNQRIQEIQDHFDEVAEAMQQGIDTFEENVNNSLGQMTQNITDLQGDFDAFVETVNQNFSDLTDDIRDDVSDALSDMQDDVSTAITDIQSQITTISNNMVTYISNHFEEWAVEAVTINFSINNDTLSCDKTLSEINNILQSGYSYKFLYNGEELICIGNRAGFPIVEGYIPIYDSNSLIIGYNVITIWIHNMSYSTSIKYVTFTEKVSNVTDCTLTNNLGNNSYLVIDSIYKITVTGGSGRYDYENVTSDVTIYSLSGNNNITGFNSGYTYIITYHFVER